MTPKELPESLQVRLNKIETQIDEIHSRFTLVWIVAMCWIIEKIAGYFL